MKILKRKATNTVIAAASVTSIESSGEICCDGTIYGDCTLENCEVIEDVTLPEKFVGGAYSYADGIWTLVNAEWVERVFPVPTLTMRQARLGLLARELLDDVEAHVATMPKASQIEWEYATEVRLDYPLVLELAALLNMSEDEMTGFFEFAELL